jgi:alpha-amylase/alpha-mannosidase (GH57 family)
MHQPFYKDLISGEYKLPWTRLHALKDYYGMVKILEEFPAIRQTFNLVPSMLAQVEEYASGDAAETYLSLALKPAEDLTPAEQDFLLQHSFHADPARMIYRFPRYGELFDARQAHRADPAARRFFRAQDLRDLQMLSQLVWFDEDVREQDPQLREWVVKGRGYSIGDQAAMGRRQRELIAQVAPQYEKMAQSGQIEISTTPYYHPILPLLCDSDIGAVSHPGLALPRRFRYPQDARRQLELARDYIRQRLNSAPAGLWPSEGSVSDEVFHLACETGFEWAATDSGVLGRTLGHIAGVNEIYRPYVWRQGKSRLSIVFRDHFLSDLIGFVYAKMSAGEAAEDFLHRIRDNCKPILARGRDALVPIILDGENAWEFYDRNGRPFFRELYSRISNDPHMQTVTVTEGLRLVEPQRLDRIFPGSWINANFDIWIGAQEDNTAWNYLLRARETYEIAKDSVSTEERQLAFEELLIAEGSDWCWWYGPEHHSDQRPEFDQLYRSHLANVYRALRRQPPEELSRPILKLAHIRELREPPTGQIRATIDGEVTTYFEWLGAGLYRVDGRSGSMHGKKFLVSEAQFGTDGHHLFLRLNFSADSADNLQATEVRLLIAPAEQDTAATIVLVMERGACSVRQSDVPVKCAYRKVLEVAAALAPLGIKGGDRLRFQFSLWQDALPVDAVPQEGWIELDLDPAWYG